jgi:hypothetical protein
MQHHLDLREQVTEQQDNAGYIVSIILDPHRAPPEGDMGAMLGTTILL